MIVNPLAGRSSRAGCCQICCQSETAECRPISATIAKLLSNLTAIRGGDVGHSFDAARIVRETKPHAKLYEAAGVVDGKERLLDPLSVRAETGRRVARNDANGVGSSVRRVTRSTPRGHPGA